MAIIHNTTLKPTKLELLTTWLPTRPWYAGSGAPELTKAGGFRLDDPEGEVGIEFMVALDTSGPEPVAYHVPLTYRAAPLPGADHALVGTMEHGVLGPRWAYDGLHDTVLRTELLALFEGRAQAMAQSISDTPDHEVAHSYAGPALPTGPAEITEDRDGGTDLTLPDGTLLRVHRTLSAAAPEGVSGQVSAPWNAPDGTRVRSVFASLRTP
ncbi:maltokinase N-terminal cap-like domain-containing protein [Streptomyces griseorubiginosus]|uniref:maltokinase N-terminal cap-like domain-containing protein n=1 Tax=Streptomyces griseorubiginosus TaxID=67304 RepID=UPI002E80FB5C|nr:1,4-alpha-glucan branching protein [Streptomyces griseorubiginosus]WUB46209.1 1,4-alpha-glucan branching protein [Streptomyces griseorubiginosus]WUB54730.1 1,4-alpha-glucan branching protein [Streptomyces griseorubiginosus]